MEVNANTPTQTCTIQGMQFSVPAPFKEGYQVTANEAAALNQVLAENLRNNFAAKIQKAREEKAGEGASDEAIAAVKLNQEALQGELTEYAKTYQFGVRTGGGAQLDPVERELRDLAEEQIRAAVKKQGIKISSVKRDQMNTLIDQVIAKDAKRDGTPLRKAAEQRVKQVAKLAVEALDIRL